MMMSFAVHTNNPYVKTTCTTCHDAHTSTVASTKSRSPKNDSYELVSAKYTNNTLCLNCHAGGGPLAYMKSNDAFANLTKDDVAALHIASGGTVLKNGMPISAPSPGDTDTSISNIAMAVAQHMTDTAKMSNVLYDPLNAAMPTGRCTSCHMPKVAKSGGYTTGSDAFGNKTLIEGDQASHVFDIIWPAQANALSRGGPTFQSGWYGQMFGPSNTKYDLFGYMPNSCSKCHASTRRAAVACAVQHADPSLLHDVETAREDARRAQEKKSGAELRESLDRYRQAVGRAVDAALQKLPHVNATYERAICALLERHGSDPVEDLPTKRPHKKKERVPKPKKPRPTKEEKRLAALLKKQEKLRVEIEALRAPRD